MSPSAHLLRTVYAHLLEGFASGVACCKQCWQTPDPTSACACSRKHDCIRDGWFACHLFIVFFLVLMVWPTNILYYLFLSQCIVSLFVPVCSEPLLCFCFDNKEAGVSNSSAQLWCLEYLRSIVRLHVHVHTGILGGFLYYKSISSNNTSRLWHALAVPTRVHVSQ